MSAYEVFVHYKTGEISTRLIAVADSKRGAAGVIRKYGMDAKGDRLRIRLLRKTKHANHPTGTLLIGPDSVHLD